MNRKHYESGIIINNQEKMAFYENDFTVTFIRTGNLDNETTIPVDGNGYVWGIDYDYKPVAFFAGEDLIIRNTKVLNTWCFIKQKNIHGGPLKSGFTGIRFSSGDLKTIFPCRALQEDLENQESGKIVYTIENDSKEFKITVDGIDLTLRFGSVISQKMSISEGTSFENKESVLDVTWVESQGLDAFFKYYKMIEKMCQFLIFRRNISFEKIQLLDGNEHGRKQVIADVFIKGEDRTSKKDPVNVIPVRIFDEKTFCKLMQSISPKRNGDLPLDIQPSIDRDALNMDVPRIKNICSAMERELGTGKIQEQTSEELNRLINEVKEIVKNHRKGEKPLSDKTYENIFGNLAHWSQPLAERIWMAWCIHKNEIQPMIERYNVNVNENSIAAFVKARNNATHNGLNFISDEVMATAFVLMGLIYCCALSRIGLDSKIIKDIMSIRFFE